MLAKLAVIYHRPDFTSAQAEVLIATYVEDLVGYAIIDLEDAIKAYRRDPKSKFFPLIGVLIDLTEKSAKDRRVSDPVECKPIIPEFGESRPILWWLQRRELWSPHWKESEIPRRWTHPETAVRAP